MTAPDLKRTALIISTFLLLAISPKAPALTLPNLLEDPMEPLKSPLQLTIMSYNIRVATPLDGIANSWNRRQNAVIDVINRYQPDVIGLQEPVRRQIDDILAGLDNYAVIGVGRSDGRNGGEFSCILYRTDRLQVTHSDTFWLSNTPENPGSKSWGLFTRICTWGRFLDRQTGRAFYLYNTHLDNASPRARENGADLMKERIAARDFSDPVIVTGDLNAGEDSRVVQFLKGSALLGDTVSPLPLIDTFRLVHPDKREAGTTGGYRGARNHKKIDYILTEPRVDVLDAKIVRDHGRGSDHYPVVATIALEH